MTGPQPAYDLDDYRRRAHAIREERQAARRDYERYSREHADAELQEDKAKAMGYLNSKAAGDTDKTADMKARQASAEAKHKASIAKSLAKSALLRVEESERDAATLRTVYDAGRREGL